MPPRLTPSPPPPPPLTPSEAEALAQLEGRVRREAAELGLAPDALPLPAGVKGPAGGASPSLFLHLVLLVLVDESGGLTVSLARLKAFQVGRQVMGCRLRRGAEFELELKRRARCWGSRPSRWGEPGGCGCLSAMVCLGGGSGQ